MSFEIRVEKTIPVTPIQAWELLATPRGYQRMFPGIGIEGDWKTGGEVAWTGEWEGKTFRDEATILAYDVPSLFQYTYYSSFHGRPRSSETIQEITFAFQPDGHGTKVSIHQTNLLTVESRDHSEKSWTDLLAGIQGPLT
jgi:uncharacterized protein YndB with AHSA1/START domain